MVRDSGNTSNNLFVLNMKKNPEETLIYQDSIITYHTYSNIICYNMVRVFSLLGFF